MILDCDPESKTGEIPYFLLGGGVGGSWIVILSPKLMKYPVIFLGRECCALTLFPISMYSTVALANTIWYFYHNQREP